MAWGRPVQTNSSCVHASLQLNTGRMLVSLAGPTMNLLMALLASAGDRDRLARSLGGFQGAIFNYLVQLNLILIASNLLPIPPLDGGAVLAWVLPRSCRGWSISCNATVLLSCCLSYLSPMLGLPLLSMRDVPHGRRDRPLAQWHLCGLINL